MKYFNIFLHLKPFWTIFKINVPLQDEDEVNCEEKKEKKSGVQNYYHMNLEDTHKPKHFCFPKTQSLTNVNISPSNLGRPLYPIQELVDYIVKSISIKLI